VAAVQLGGQGFDGGGDVQAPRGGILPVRGGPQEQRRLLLAHLPAPLGEPAARVAEVLRAAVLDAERE
jgi:hypothetical protein